MKTDRLRQNVKRFLKGGTIRFKHRIQDEKGVFKRVETSEKVPPGPKSTEEIANWINKTTSHGTTKQQLGNVLSKDVEIVKTGYVRRWGSRYGSYHICEWSLREQVDNN